MINLSLEKSAVFAEAFRVLQPGGRLAISDVVATGPGRGARGLRRRRGAAGRRARHPLPAEPAADDRPAAALGEALGEAGHEDDREAARALASCVSLFVARLPSPYREAVTLVELQGLTAREAAELAGISVSGMKSRVQRGRAQLRQLLDECCEIALDVRGKVTAFAPRPRPCACKA